MEENFQTNLKLVEKLTTLAKKHNATPGQLSLAWILAQGGDFIPIPGYVESPPYLLYTNNNLTTT